MVNQKLRSARIRQGLSFSELARRAKVSEVNCCRYESGTRKPLIDFAIKIADALGVKDLRELWPPNSANAS